MADVNERLKLKRQTARARKRRCAAEQDLHAALSVLQWAKAQVAKAEKRLFLAEFAFDRKAEVLRDLGSKHSSVIRMAGVDEEKPEPESGDKVVGSDGGPAAGMISLDKVDEGGDEDGEE